MAAYNLFDLSHRVAQEAGSLLKGVASGGSATTLVDNIRLLDQYGNDWFNLGTLWIIKSTDGLAPQGEYARISDFAQSTGTITVPASALTAAPGAGDRYAAAPARYDLDNIIAVINTVLGRIKVPTEDTTTLDTAASQLEYSLPAGVLDEDIEVWLQTNTGDADSNQWVRTHNWYLAETGTGTQKKLIFYNQPLAVVDIKVRYYIPHTPLYVYTDKLREGVDINRVVYAAAAVLLKDELNQMSSQDKALMARIDRLERDAAMWSTPSKRQSHKLATFGISTIYADTED